MSKTVAVVPMRHNSERVPGKNYRPLAGIPLYHHIIKTLQQVSEIDLIVIDTDSEVIIEDCKKNFPEVRILLRPANLQDGGTPMNDVLLNTIRQLDAETILQTHSTNPFLKSQTVSRALELFSGRSRTCDSIFSVTRMQCRLWNADAQPVNHDPTMLLRTQDLPPLFIENSCFFIFRPEVLREHRTRIGAKPMMFELSPLEAVDIDTEDDFALASAIADGGKTQI